MGSNAVESKRQALRFDLAGQGNLGALESGRAGRAEGQRSSRSAGTRKYLAVAELPTGERRRRAPASDACQRRAGRYEVLTRARLGGGAAEVRSGEHPGGDRFPEIGRASCRERV